MTCAWPPRYCGGVRRWHNRERRASQEGSTPFANLAQAHQPAAQMFVDPAGVDADPAMDPLCVAFRGAFWFFLLFVLHTFVVILCAAHVPESKWHRQTTKTQACNNADAPDARTKNSLPRAKLECHSPTCFDPRQAIGPIAIQGKPQLSSPPVCSMRPVRMANFRR